jgi:hypothetical protein
MTRLAIESRAAIEESRRLAVLVRRGADIARP